MSTPKKPSTPAPKKAAPKTSAPSWRAEMTKGSAAVQRTAKNRNSWSLDNILREGARNVGMAMGFADNVSNAASDLFMGEPLGPAVRRAQGRPISPKPTTGTMPEWQRNVVDYPLSLYGDIGDFIDKKKKDWTPADPNAIPAPRTAGELARKAADTSAAQKSGKRRVPYWGGRGMEIITRDEARRRSEEYAPQAALNELVDNERKPLLQRLAKKAENSDNRVAKGLAMAFDPDAGTGHSLEAAGFSPEASMALQSINPAQLTPLDFTGALGMAALRKVAKPSSKVFNFEGVFPKERGLFGYEGTTGGRYPFSSRELPGQGPPSDPEGRPFSQRPVVERPPAPAGKYKPGTVAEKVQSAARAKRNAKGSSEFTDAWKAELKAAEAESRAAEAEAKAGAVADFDKSWRAELQAKEAEAQGVAEFNNAWKTELKNQAANQAANSSASRGIANLRQAEADTARINGPSWRASLSHRPALRLPQAIDPRAPVADSVPDVSGEYALRGMDDAAPLDPAAYSGPPRVPDAPPPPSEAPVPPQRPALPSWRSSLPDAGMPQSVRGGPQEPPRIAPQGITPDAPTAPMVAPDLPSWRNAGQEAPLAPTQPRFDPPAAVQTPEPPRPAAAPEAPGVPDAPAVGSAGSVDPVAPPREVAAPVVGAGDAPPTGLEPPSSGVYQRNALLATAALGGAFGLGFASSDQAKQITNPTAIQSFISGSVGIAAMLGLGYLGLKAWDPIANAAGKSLPGKAFGAMMRGAESAIESTAKTAADFGYSRLPVPVKEFTDAVRQNLQYTLSKTLMSDSVPNREILSDAVEYAQDLEQASARRAQDEWGPLRNLPENERQLIMDALKDPAEMRKLVAANPTLGGVAKDARTKISQLTQEILRDQFGVDDATWRAMNNAQKIELGRLLQNGMEGLTSMEGLAPGTTLEALVKTRRAKLLAEGSIRRVPNSATPEAPDGAFEFTDPMLEGATALKNLETYLQRKYAVFEGARGKVTLKEVMAKHGASLTQEEREHLAQLLAPMGQDGASNSQRIAMFLQRNHLSPELKAALGEITNDPGYLVAKTIHDMERHLTLSKLRRAIATNTDYVMPMGADPAPYIAKGWIPLKGTAADYGDLVDRVVHPEVADVLHAHFAAHNPGSLRRGVDFAMGGWKWSKTVANPSSHMRQWIQNAGALDLAGDGLVSGISRIKHALKEMSTLGPMYKEARDAGLFRGAFHDQELSGALHQAILQVPPGSSLSHLGAIGEAMHAVASGAKKAKNWADAKWQLGDDATRLALYDYARNVEGMTPREAIAYIRETTYDASQMSRLERALSGRGMSKTMKSPGGATKAFDALGVLASAPFLMAQLFSLKQMKALGGVSRVGSHWMPMTDPALAFRASKYWAIPAMAAGLAGSEVMDERPDYAQPFLDNWLPSSVPLPEVVSRFMNGEGKPEFVDVSPFTPGGELARAVIDTRKTSNKNLSPSSILGATSMTRGLPPTNPIVQAWFDFNNSTDSYSGRPITMEADGTAAARGDKVAYITRQLLPDAVPGIPAALVSGDPSQILTGGGRLWRDFATGGYNSLQDAIGGQRLTNRRMENSTLPRAILGLAGVRSYMGDGEKNRIMGALTMRKAAKNEQSRFRSLMVGDPKSSEATRKRRLNDFKNRMGAITQGGVKKLPGPFDRR